MIAIVFAGKPDLLIADEIAVMYQGKIIEHGSVEQLLSQPEHTYTKKLLDAVPVLNIEK
ncbi:MAG: hypothetical protein LUQ56_01725 [Methylococcaceae bacterium]|jgi:peptide/nickel transport system ATP-binding protein|nr:hypothetical protein [Methylococcaceae bacterium]MDD1636840.1 hypothetical protein [Methylococcaceae bacterium]MDD1643969.1 hypothetical protein [Methylococcaceae bacterium]OYV20660.1 MAG: peptide/nickel transport system ATP-binding protein [Methylococcaceae bacterium NSM2-1]